MARRFTEDTLVIASHNPGKVREIAELLAPYSVQVKSGMEYGFQEPEETGSSFIENAEIKSRYFATKTKLPSLSDDSGLVVPALQGMPGIYSARWAGENKDFYVAIERIRQELVAKGERAEGAEAHFVCALSLCWPDGEVENVEGKVFGTLTFPPRGKKGFGYDPIFVPRGYKVTFAEMEPAAKHEISHRADAFRKLIARCF